MKWTVVALLVVGCQKTGDKPSQPPPDDAYRADIYSICDCVHLSGADKLPKDEQWPAIALWLGPQIKTPEGHAFLVKIQPLEGEAKASALDAEAHRVGLTSCALSAEWRQ